MNLVGAFFGLNVVISVLNAPLSVDDGQYAIIFDHFRGVIEDANGENSKLIGSFLQKALVAFAEENSGILAFPVSKAPFLAS